MVEGEVPTLIRTGSDGCLPTIEDREVSDIQRLVSVHILHMCCNVHLVSDFDLVSETFMS